MRRTYLIYLAMFGVGVLVTCLIFGGFLLFGRKQTKPVPDPVVRIAPTSKAPTKTSPGTVAIKVRQTATISGSGEPVKTSRKEPPINVAPLPSEVENPDVVQTWIVPVTGQQAVTIIDQQGNELDTTQLDVNGNLKIERHVDSTVFVSGTLQTEEATITVKQSPAKFPVLIIDGGITNLGWNAGVTYNFIRFSHGALGVEIQRFEKTGVLYGVKFTLAF